MKKEKPVSITMVSLADIVSNRYRNSARYRYVLQPEKIAALLQSYEQSGFWDGSIQARPCPDKAGKYEIAFGHHRVAAAKQSNKIRKLGLVVAPRSDADMLRMMCDENRAEFKHDALVGRESIAAVIEAYGRGEIELEPVTPADTAGRRDGIYSAGNKSDDRQYTCLTVARFLNWTKADGTQASEACRRAFEAYQEQSSTDEALSTIPPEKRSEVAVRTVIEASRAAKVAARDGGLPPAKILRAQKEAAKEAAKEVLESSGFKAQRQAATIGKEAAKRAAAPKAKALPPIEVYAARLIAKCEKSIGRYDDILTECRRLTPFIEDLNKKLANQLADALLKMLKRDAEGVKNVVSALRAGRSAGRTKALLALLEA